MNRIARRTLAPTRRTLASTRRTLAPTRRTLAFARRTLAPTRSTLALALTLVAALVAPAGAAAAATATGHAKHHRSTPTSRRARTVSFYARVVRSSRSGLLLRRASGKTVYFSAHQLARKTRSHKSRRGTRVRRSAKHGLLARTTDTTTATPPVSVNIVGLQPGVTVLVTETVNPDGSVTITITLPPAGTTGEQSASGTVSEVDTDAFDVVTSDGSDLRLHMAADALSSLNLSSCETVDVAYHQDTGMLIADTVQQTGTSSSGDCQQTNDVTGAITALSGTAVTVSTDQGAMSFTVDSSDITDGFLVGDQVDVTYVQNSDGSLDAIDVEYVEQDASGTVTQVSASSMTITDSTSGKPETFDSDPSAGVQLDGASFDGVQVGDQVDVTYHASSSQLVADDVSDNGPGSSGDASGGPSGGSSGGDS